MQTTEFAADFTHADVGYTTDSGSAALVLFGGWTAQAGTQYDIGPAGAGGACLFGTEYDFDVFDQSLFGADLQIRAPTNALVVPRGTQASSTLTITPVEGPTGTITLRCTGSPTLSSCTRFQWPCGWFQSLAD